MSELDRSNVESAVYRLEEKNETVGTAKSQFAKEHDVDYNNLKGKIILNLGTGWGKRPSYCVVAEVPE
jgi:hypothetical protein